MKIPSRFFILIVSFLIIFFPGCASGPQKAAMDYAAGVNFNFDPQTNIENLCVIICKENAHIETIDGIYQDDAVVLPGIHHLAVQYRHSNYYNLGSQSVSSSSTSELISIIFTFEPGKHYYLDYKITEGETIFTNDTIQFSIEELNDPALIQRVQNTLAEVKSGLEKQKPYLTFSEINPNHLEGLWETYPIKINFSRDGRYTFSATILGRENARTSEGRYFFDDQTIVLVAEKETGDRAHIRQKKIWYYKLEGGFLSITVPGDDPIMVNTKLRKNS
jgi:hypothetical protein